MDFGPDDETLVPWLAIVGVCLLAGAFALGVGAIRFEFVYVGETTTPADAAWMIDYSDLTATDQALVDNAMDGTRYVTENFGALPGPGKGDLAVNRDGTWHLFARNTIFVATTPLGLAALGSALLGVLFIGLAIRTDRWN